MMAAHGATDLEYPWRLTPLFANSIGISRWMGFPDVSCAALMARCARNERSAGRRMCGGKIVLRLSISFELRG